MGYKKGLYILLPLAILLVYLFIDPISLADSKPTKLNVYISNNIISMDQADHLMNQFKLNIVGDETDDYIYQIDTDILLSVKAPSPAELIDAGRFTAQIAANELDILITDEEIVRHYTELDGFSDLSKIEQLDLRQFDNSQMIRDEERIYSIKLEDQLGKDKPQWISIPKTSQRKDMATMFIVYLLEGESI